VWVHCCRLAIAIICVRFALSLQCLREWSDDKRSKLFFTEFNARVNWIRPATGVTQTGQSKPPTKLLRIILDFQNNVMLISVSCETPENVTVRHVSRVTGGPRHPWKFFRNPEKMYWTYFKPVGHSSNNCVPYYRTLRHLWCTKLTTGLITDFLHFILISLFLHDSVHSP